jgi:hypothetical protein
MSIPRNACNAVTGQSGHAPEIRIPIDAIASVTIEHKHKNYMVVITQRDGHVDAFQVVRSVMIDREKTEEAGKLIQSRLVPVASAEATP